MIGRRLLGLATIALLLSGCATTGDATPAGDPATTQTPDARISPSPATGATTPPASPRPAAETHAPTPIATRGPDEADPADYVSDAIDTVNGGVLPGVAFRTEDGRIICGIFTTGHGSTPGTASCTVDTYKEILPQPGAGSPPYVMSVVVSPETGASGLYPDWFAQPQREIPVLDSGMTLLFEGTACTVDEEPAVTCMTATQRGFRLSTTGYSYI